MSLTEQDLAAIKDIVNESVNYSIDTRVPIIVREQVQPMLDALEDRVDKKFARHEAKMDGKLAAMETRLIARMDEMDESICIQVEHGLDEVRVGLKEVQFEVQTAQHQLAKLEDARRTSLPKNPAAWHNKHNQ